VQDRIRPSGNLPHRSRISVEVCLSKTLWSTPIQTKSLSDYPWENRCPLAWSRAFKAHGWTHHQGMGKPLGLHFEVPRDGRLVHDLEFYYGLSWVVCGHIDAKSGGFSSHGRNDEQYRLEPMRSTAFKVWLKFRDRGEVMFVSSAIIVPYLVWVEQYMTSIQKEILLSTNCHNGSWGKVTLAWPTACIPYIIWLGQRW
jgi:hypothetical protein